MKSRIAGEKARMNTRRTFEREQQVPSTGMRQEATRGFRLKVAVSTRLPVLPNEGIELQNEVTGEFYFLAGYSAIGGPDIVR